MTFQMILSVLFVLYVRSISDCSKFYQEENRQGRMGSFRLSPAPVSDPDIHNESMYMLWKGFK